MPGEPILQGTTFFKLLFFSIIGGWVAGALGLGGGAIFNPLLLSVGVPPKVATSTGMYMIFFGTAVSTFSYIINDMLNYSYGLFIAFWSILGTYFGMMALEKIMKKLGRQSPLVILLFFV